MSIKSIFPSWEEIDTLFDKAVVYLHKRDWL